MRWKRTLILGVWLFAVGAWAALAVFYFVTTPSISDWTMAVAVVAVATEIAFWATAAMLGLSVWEGRKAIWRFITRPFRASR